MNVLFAAATAMMIVAACPAFATFQGYTAQPLPGECHFLKERVVLPNGHVVFLTSKQQFDVYGSHPSTKLSACERPSTRWEFHDGRASRLGEQRLGMQLS
jgi:hypothetical protein